MKHISPLFHKLNFGFNIDCAINPILLVSRRHIYWPPPSHKRSKIIELPSGKKCFVFMGKRDVDGKLEPVCCFIDKLGNKLLWLNREEIIQMEKLVNMH